MTSLFADTFYWIALADSTNSAHQRALTVTREMAPSPIITTDEVLAEFLSFFSGATGPVRVRAARTVQRLLLNPAIRIIPQSRGSFLSGLDLYAQRLDNRRTGVSPLCGQFNRYSLTDCVSMQTMRAEGITSALTNDRHFEQEGFRALFREST